jgi:hypothetical protein
MNSTKHGFGLAEVLIASVFISLLALGLAQLLKSSMSYGKTVEQNTEWSNLNTSLQQALKTDCVSWVHPSDKLPMRAIEAGHQFSVAIFRGQEQLALTGLALNNSGARLEDVSLKLTESLAAPSTPADTRRARAELLLSISRGQAFGGSSKNNHASPIRLVLDFDGNNELVACSLADGNPGPSNVRYLEAFWNSSGPLAQTQSFQIVNAGPAEELSSSIRIAPVDKDRVLMLQTQIQFEIIGPSSDTAAYVGIDTSLNGGVSEPCNNAHTFRWAGIGLRPRLGTSCSLFVPAGSTPTVSVRTQALPASTLIHDRAASQSRALLKIVELDLHSNR